MSQLRTPLIRHFVEIVAKPHKRTRWNLPESLISTQFALFKGLVSACGLGVLK